MKQWEDFKEGIWKKEVNVSDFIQKNYESYDLDESFLKGKTSKTDKVWKTCEELLKEELKKHVLDIDTTNMSGIDNFMPGYIDKENEVIVGLQTDKPLKRIVNPYGGIRMVYSELESYHYKLDENVDKYFNLFRKTHNQGVFDCYTDEIKKMASRYGYDISVPASNAKEAIQWTYFAYLAAIKENNGAAMSMGRVDAFFDIYINRDMKRGMLTEEEAQELIDQFVIKLRLVRHLRTPEYDELFSGDPTWVTCSIGGVTVDKKSMVTKTSYRILHTLTNLDPAPEPNLTVLWSEYLPDTFKKYCSKMSIETDSIQYENDDVMRPIYGDDYAIACCVSAMREGRDMQFFGARCNLAKALLYSMNGGIDEVTGDLVIDGFDKNSDEILDYEKVKDMYFKMLEEVCKIYADSMNIIHYMHDKYAYEASQMALHDTNVNRLMAYGVAGLSVVCDSLSAIKYASVKPIRNDDGIIVDFSITGDFPKYGNDDDRVDSIAVMVLEKMYQELKKHPCYRDATPTLSVLTITSNVVYGKKTGSTPDGRKKGVPFAPGANPMHGRDSSGAISSLNSVAKIPYQDCCRDGISNTFSIVPNSLGHTMEERVENLVSLLDGYFIQGAHHLNVNVLNRETLVDAMEHPEKYPLLTIRVSGYAVRFNRLTRVQQEEVISRTFHEKI